jgi:hypothetical protein
MNTAKAASIEEADETPNASATRVVLSDPTASPAPGVRVNPTQEGARTPSDRLYETYYAFALSGR